MNSRESTPKPKRKLKPLFEDEVKPEDFCFAMADWMVGMVMVDLEMKGLSKIVRISIHNQRRKHRFNWGAGGFMKVL